MAETTIQVERETAELIRLLFPGMTYDAAIQQLLTKSGQTKTISFSKTIAYLEEESVEHQVPFNGYVSEVVIYFPAGCEGAVDVRLLYFENGSKQFVLPAIENTYIALDDTTQPFRRLNFPVKAGGRLKAEFLNYDGTHDHTITLVATVISSPIVGR